MCYTYQIPRAFIPFSMSSFYDVMSDHHPFSSESVAEESVLTTNEEETSTLASECLPTSTWSIEPTTALQSHLNTSHVTYIHNFQTHLHSWSAHWPLRFSSISSSVQNPQYLCTVGYRSFSSSMFLVIEDNDRSELAGIDRPKSVLPIV